MRSARLLLMCFLGLALLLPACTPIPERIVKPTGADNQGLITVNVMDLSFTPGLDIVVKAFYAKYPNYRVNTVHLPPGSDPLDAIRSKLARGGVDVIVTGSGTVPTSALAEENLLEPFDSWLTKNQFDSKPFGKLLSELAVEGHLYELPFQASPYMIVYSADAFRQAGVAAPRPEWTWDQLRGAARAMTAGSDDGGRWGLWTDLPMELAYARLSQKAPDNPWADEQALRETLAFFHTLSYDDKSLSAVHPDSPNTIDLFAKGKASMLFTSTQSFPWIQKAAVSFDWNVAPYPILVGHQSRIPARISGFTIAAQSRNKEGAWQFIRFAAGADGAAALASAGQVPVYRTDAVKRAWFTLSQPAGTESLFQGEWFRTNPQGRIESQLDPLLRDLVSQVLSDPGPYEKKLSNYLREVSRIRASDTTGR